MNRASGTCLNDVKESHIHTNGILEEEERDNGTWIILEAMTVEVFPNLVKNRNALNQDAQWTPSKIKSQSQAHCSRAAESQLLQPESHERQWHIACRRMSTQLTVDFTSEAMEVRRYGTESSKRWKFRRKTCQPTIIHPVKISFENEGKIKTSSDKRKWMACALSRSSLPKMLKGVLLLEGKWRLAGNWDPQKLAMINMWVFAKDYLFCPLKNHRTT